MGTTYNLIIDGPAFRNQRNMIEGILNTGVLNQHDANLMLGLIELCDSIADQAIDSHGIDCAI